MPCTESAYRDLNGKLGKIADCHGKLFVGSVGIGVDIHIHGVTKPRVIRHRDHSGALVYGLLTMAKRSLIV
jgi:hypothetical protein